MQNILISFLKAKGFASVFRKLVTHGIWPTCVGFCRNVLRGNHPFDEAWFYQRGKCALSAVRMEPTEKRNLVLSRSEHRYSRHPIRTNKRLIALRGRWALNICYGLGFLSRRPFLCGRLERR